MKTSILFRRPWTRWLLLILLLPAPLALAATYTLPDVRPAGCSKNSNTSVTCSSLSLGWGDSIVVTYANTTLTVTGIFTCGGNSINASSPVAGFTISAKSISSNGGSCAIGGDLIATNDDITTGNEDRITGSITSNKGAVTIAASNARVGGSISAKNKITLGHGARVTGNVTSSNDEVVLNSSDVSVGGNVSAKKKVTLGHGSSVGGDVTSDIDEVLLLSSTARVSGNVTAQKKVTLEHGTQVSGNVTSTHEEVELKSSDAQVGGCVTVDKNKEIKLGWHARVGGVCCLSGSTCGTSCVDNDSGYAKPSSSLCQAGGAPASLSAHYKFDDTWSRGDTLEDSSGNGKHASLNGTVDQSSAPAANDKPATCKAGHFNQTGWFTTTSLDVNTGDGDKNSVSFWMYWDGGFNSHNFTMPFSWGGSYYDLSISKYLSSMGNGVIGFNTGNGDVYGVSASGLANGWHHVAAVFNNGDITQNKLYIDGVAKTLSSHGSHSQRSATTTAGIGAGAYWNGDYKWSGKLDQLKVYKGEITQAQVQADQADSNTCVELTLPVTTWRMDETAWNGTAAEVQDSGTLGRHGQAAGDATTSEGKVCRAGRFDGNGDYASVAGLSDLLNGTASLSFWIKTTQTGNNTAWMAPGVTGIEIAGGTNDIFWGWIDASGHIGIAMGDDNSSKSTQAINDGNWHHVVLTRNSGNGAYKIYIDGSLNKSGNLATTTIGNSYTSLGRIEDSGGTPADLNGQLDEVHVFDSVLSDADVSTGYANENAGRNWDGSTRICATTSTAPAALNAVDVGTSAVSGQITTKVAGTAFNLDIVALKDGALDTAATGDVLVDLLANTGTGVALDANNCPTSSTALTVGTATLTTGKATVAIAAITDSWRDVRVRMRYPASGPTTVTACSADNFAVKPAALSAIASHGDWQSAGDTTLNNTAASGGVVHKAGQPFKLRVTGYNAANAITANYNGSPTASSTCVLPASGCLAGTLSTGSFTASSGTVASSTATYSEVGAISATFTDTAYAAVDSDDTAASCAGFHVCASAIPIGRFVPDHYDVISIQTPVLQTFASACAGRSFTYVGQSFGFQTLPRARITAKNAAGGTTGNYRGSLWKLNPNGHFSTSRRCQKTGGASCGSVRVSTPGFSAEQVSVNGDGSGDFTWPADEDFPHGMSYQFIRTTPPPAPFNAEIGLGIGIHDTSEAAGCGVAGCQIRDSQAAGSLTWGSHIAFDAGNEFRQGRLRLANAMGSERLPLPVRLTAQYWNGAGWATNTDDHCTPLTAPTLTFFSQTADNRLASGETTASFNATLVAGNGNLRFSAPGVGNFGYMNVSAPAPDWLKYDWDGDNVLDDDPVARATFGKRKGRDKIIIRRETY